MTARRRFLLAGLGGMLGACATFVPNEVSYTGAEIQARLARRFPWKRTYFGLLDLELTNPAIRLDAERNRIATAFDAALRIRGSSRAYTGHAAISGLPRYDPDQRAFFLAESSLDNLELQGVPRALMGELQTLGRALAPELFATTPLYTLRPEEGRLFGTEMVATGVRVVGDRLVVGLAPKR